MKIMDAIPCLIRLSSWTVLIAHLKIVQNNNDDKKWQYTQYYLFVPFSLPFHWIVTQKSLRALIFFRKNKKKSLHLEPQGYNITDHSYGHQKCQLHFSILILIIHYYVTRGTLIVNLVGFQFQKNKNKKFGRFLQNLHAILLFVPYVNLSLFVFLIFRQSQ